MSSRVQRPRALLPQEERREVQPAPAQEVPKASYLSDQVLEAAPRDPRVVLLEGFGQVRVQNLHADLRGRRRLTRGRRTQPHQDRTLPGTQGRRDVLWKQGPRTWKSDSLKS